MKKLSKIIAAFTILVTLLVTTGVPIFASSKTNLSIAKLVTGTTTALSGAKLVIKSADGTNVAAWTSGQTPYGLALADGTYTLSETAAPTGYQKAAAITFKVVNGRVYEQVGDAWKLAASQTSGFSVSKLVLDASDVSSYCFKVNDQTAFGGDPAKLKASTTGVSGYSLTTITNSKLAGVLTHGYGTAPLPEGLTEAEFAKVTQAAVWQVLGYSVEHADFTSKMNTVYESLLTKTADEQVDVYSLNDASWQKVYAIHQKAPSELKLYDQKAETTAKSSAKKAAKATSSQTEKTVAATASSMASSTNTSAASSTSSTSSSQKASSSRASTSSSSAVINQKTTVTGQVEPIGGQGETGAIFTNATSKANELPQTGEDVVSLAVLGLVVLGFAGGMQHYNKKRA